MVTELELELQRKVDRLEKEVLTLREKNRSQKKLFDSKYKEMSQMFYARIKTLTTEKRIIKNYNASVNRARKDRKDYLELCNTEYVIQQVSLISGIPYEELIKKQKKEDDTTYIRNVQYIIYYLLRVYVCDSISKIHTLYPVYSRDNSDFIFSRVEELRIKTDRGFYVPHPVIQKFQEIVGDKIKTVPKKINV